MSAELDKMYQALMFQRVPDLWSNVGYLSLKPLGSWFKDLIQRIEFFDKWITQGPPAAFWMSAFFFPQGYMTAVVQTHARSETIAGYMTAAVQTYARSETIAIDTLDFRTEVIGSKSNLGSLNLKVWFVEPGM
ncbi:dynein heavy chain and region D6 of dynein motor-domain-containing protein [Baffinella frigidus]|nr:dynein heavy chain and region D6 of dynein motor-domain-containing protein [Cryptophyta sp. CCMP2293]